MSVLTISTAKHHEPVWLYEKILFAEMDQTFLYQFVFLTSLLAAGRLLNDDDESLVGWFALSVFGAAHLLTAGHLLTDPLSAFAFDAALSIVGESVAGLAVAVVALARCVELVRRRFLEDDGIAVKTK